MKYVVSFGKRSIESEFNELTETLKNPEKKKLNIAPQAKQSKALSKIRVIIESKNQL